MTKINYQGPRRPCAGCHEPGVSVLPRENQFSRQRQARNVSPNIGPQVQLPGKHIEGIVSWLSGHLHHDVAIEDVGGEKHLARGESPLREEARNNLPFLLVRAELHKTVTASLCFC